MYIFYMREKTWRNNLTIKAFIITYLSRQRNPDASFIDSEIVKITIKMQLNPFVYIIKELIRFIYNVYFKQIKPTKKL